MRAPFLLASSPTAVSTYAGPSPSAPDPFRELLPHQQSLHCQLPQPPEAPARPAPDSQGFLGTPGAAPGTLRQKWRGGCAGSALGRAGSGAPGDTGSGVLRARGVCCARGGAKWGTGKCACGAPGAGPSAVADAEPRQGVRSPPCQGPGRGQGSGREGKARLVCPWDSA